MKAELLDAAGRRKRKTSPRPVKTKVKRPDIGPIMRAKWADPEWVAKNAPAFQAGRDKLKNNPELGTRRGVPDGMRKAEADAIWAKAAEYSKRLIKIMEDAGEFTPAEVTVPGSEEEMGKQALAEAFKIALGPLTHAVTKNAAIRTVLEWTKAKPESKSSLNLNGAEQWLAQVQADMKAKSGSNPGDGGAS